MQAVNIIKVEVALYSSEVEDVLEEIKTLINEGAHDRLVQCLLYNALKEIEALKRKG